MELSAVFSAVSDPTRREILGRLRQGPASVSTIAGPLTMSLPAVSHHLDVLEAAGVIRRTKVGRVRYCELDPRPLMAAESWLIGFHAFFDARLDRLVDQLTPEKKELP